MRLPLADTQRVGRLPHFALPRVFEYWYFGQVFYAVMGTALGVSVGSLGVAALALLALCCVLRIGRRPLPILLPLALPLTFGVTYVATQVLVFGEPIRNADLRPFVPWLLTLVIIHCLALRRGFLHRFTIAAFLIGLCTLPYLTLYRGSTRVGLESGVGIANPNDLAAWFGYCCLYFAVLGLETRRMSVRLVSWLAAVGCTVIVALTISRGPLFAAAVGMLVASRRVLNRGFVPALSLVTAAWIVYEAGVLDQSASRYLSRGLEESGRFLVWPLAIDRFLDSPLTGVGVSNFATWVPQRGISMTPHNSFILIALASGVIPLLLFVAYWMRLGVDVFRIHMNAHEDAAFLVPLFVYVFLITLQLNQPFMFPWAMATLGSVCATGFLLKARGEVAAGRPRLQGTRRVHPARLAGLKST